MNNYRITKTKQNNMNICEHINNCDKGCNVKKSQLI